MSFCKEMREHRENARADKDRFSDNLTLSARPKICGFLSDKPGFSEKQPTLSADDLGFSEQPTLSQRNPYYLIR